jgi:hypothetical protein
MRGFTRMVQKTNFRLLAAVRKKCGTQRNFANVIRKDGSYVSRVINGVWNLKEEEKVEWARLLKMTVEELF